jgi:hypothetical protein
VELPPEPSGGPVNAFTIMQLRLGANPGAPNRLLWDFVCDRTVRPDISPTPRGLSDYGHKLGTHRWSDDVGHSDRISYGTAWAVWLHSDVGGHGLIPAIRFVWQDFGGTNLINDRYMREDPFGIVGPSGEKQQGLNPYPYERVMPQAIDRSRPGGVVEIIHLRQGANQLLERITIPAVEPENPQTRWYYQLDGRFVAVNAGLVSTANPTGAIAKLIISGMHGSGGPAAAYTYRIAGVPTGGAATYPPAA